MAAMADHNLVSTQFYTNTLGLEIGTDSFNKPWKYSTVLGMLMYLASNSHNYIALSVHQCARFTHASRQSHAKAVKRIITHIKLKEDKGLILEASQNLQIDFYVEADFYVIWGVEEDQNPLCVISCTGFIIIFMGCPLTWVYKLQYKIPFITMEE